MPPGVHLGTVQTNGGRVSVAFDAATSLDSAVRAVNDALPAAGFTIGDAEKETRDAELSFSGNGVRGRYQFVRINDCAVHGTVAVQPA